MRRHVWVVEVQDEATKEWVPQFMRATRRRARYDGKSVAWNSGAKFRITKYEAVR